MPTENSNGPKRTHTYYAGDNDQNRRRSPEERQQAHGGKTVVRRNGGKKPGGNPITNFFRDLTPMRRNILIGCTAFVLIVAILLVILIPSCTAVPPASSTSLPSTSLVEDDYDPEANVINIELLQGTVLSVTEDAGQEYIDDTVFLGDSNTVRMLSYRDRTGVTIQNAIGVEGMGIQQVTSYQCVKFEGYASLVTMPEAIAILQPRRVVITFGTNNVGGMSTENFIKQYTTAVEAIQKAYEYADIIIGGVPPVDINNHAGIKMTNVDLYNVALAELADELGVKFLNWAEAMKDPATGYAKSTHTVSDGYHISGDGMVALFDYFRTHAYITEDNRPERGTIPTRIAADVSLIKGDENTTTRSTTSVVASSSQLAQTVNLVYAVSPADGNGGKLTIGSSTYSSYSETVELGQNGVTVTAATASGYTFKEWRVNGTRVSTTASYTYTVPEDASNGDTITITAVFEAIASSSSSSSSSSSTPAPGGGDGGGATPDPSTPDPSTSIPSIPNPDPSIPDPTPSEPDENTSVVETTTSDETSE